MLESGFQRPHHHRIARVLSALNGPLLRENNCLFGGGTAIALRYGEYREAVAKAEAAYGQSILRDLQKNIAALHTRPGRLERCMQVMAMSLPKAVLWQKIRALRRVLPTEGTLTSA